MKYIIAFCLCLITLNCQADEYTIIDSSKGGGSVYTMEMGMESSLTTGTVDGKPVNIFKIGDYTTGKVGDESFTSWTVGRSTIMSMDDLKK